MEEKLAVYTEGACVEKLLPLREVFEVHFAVKLPWTTYFACTFTLLEIGEIRITAQLANKVLPRVHHPIYKVFFGVIGITNHVD